MKIVCINIGVQNVDAHQKKSLFVQTVIYAFKAFGFTKNNKRKDHHPFIDQLRLVELQKNCHYTTRQPCRCWTPLAYSVLKTK